MGDDIRRLVFSDEIWAKTKMTPLRGWAARGKRLIGKACFGPTTPDQVPGRLFIATLRHDATTAIWVINGPIYGKRRLRPIDFSVAVIGSGLGSRPMSSSGSPG